MTRWMWVLIIVSFSLVVSNEAASDLQLIDAVVLSETLDQFEKSIKSSWKKDVAAMLSTCVEYLKSCEGTIEFSFENAEKFCEQSSMKDLDQCMKDRNSMLSIHFCSFVAEKYEYEMVSDETVAILTAYNVRRFVCIVHKNLIDKDPKCFETKLNQCVMFHNEKKCTEPCPKTFVQKRQIGSLNNKTAKFNISEELKKRLKMNRTIKASEPRTLRFSTLDKDNDDKVDMGAGSGQEEKKEDDKGETTAADKRGSNGEDGTKGIVDQEDSECCKKIDDEKNFQQGYKNRAYVIKNQWEFCRTEELNLKINMDKCERPQPGKAQEQIRSAGELIHSNSFSVPIILCSLTCFLLFSFY